MVIIVSLFFSRLFVSIVCMYAIYKVVAIQAYRCACKKVYIFFSNWILTRQFLIALSLLLLFVVILVIIDVDVVISAKMRWLWWLYLKFWRFKSAEKLAMPFLFSRRFLKPHWSIDRPWCWDFLFFVSICFFFFAWNLIININSYIVAK